MTRIVNSRQIVIALILILIVPAFLLKNYSYLASKRDLSCSFSSDVLPFDEFSEEKSFVFLLYGNGDKNSIHQCLSSIFIQKYDNYRIIFIETNETESLLADLAKLAAKEGKQNRLFFLHHEPNTPLIESFRIAIESCKKDEIIVQLATSDWLAHENVLAKLNLIYSHSQEVWLTYSEYIEYPSYKKGHSNPTPKRMLRNRHLEKTPWLSSPLKTYYARLFHDLHIDLSAPCYAINQDDNLNTLMISLVEQAKHHIRFIDDVLYVRVNPSKSASR